jgi:hypothetical protein
MLGDHMLCGAGKAGFMFRIGVTQQPLALPRPGARMMEFNGRRFRGFDWVDPARCPGPHPGILGRSRRTLRPGIAAQDQTKTGAIR